MPFALTAASHKAKRGSCLVKVNLPFEKAALQTAGTGITSEPPRCLTESLGSLTSCNYCLELYTTGASVGAVKRGEKCKQRSGLDVPLILSGNYSSLWSAVGCLRGDNGPEVKHH